MILRTVHMHFRPEAVPEFLALFEAHRDAIASQPGCRAVHLIQSQDTPERLGTVSLWAVSYTHLTLPTKRIV